MLFAGFRRGAIAVTSALRHREITLAGTQIALGSCAFKYQSLRADGFRGIADLIADKTGKAVVNLEAFGSI